MVATWTEGLDVIINLFKDDWNRANTGINITVDMRTIKSRTHLQSLENEVRRLIHSKRKGDGTNFDRLVFKTRTDLSDRSKKMFRMTFQIEVVILAELIP